MSPFLDIHCGPAGAGPADVLARVGFGAADEAFVLPLREVGGESWCESWSGGAGERRSGVCGNLRFAANEGLAFGVVSVDDPPGADARDLGQQAYRQILDWLAGQPCGHLWRIWNVMRDINGGVGDDERYRRFCVGRHEALAAAGLSAEAFPAATAIGSVDSAMTVMFLAGSEPARHLGNPRQLDAFDYPPDYGPQSPSFARASITPATLGAPRLLVSGTGSVVGHESRHPGDIGAQFDEVLRNVAAVVAQAGADYRPVAHKVFLRDAAHAALARREMSARFGAVPTIYLEGDICRRELLLEVEGVYARP